MIASTWFVLEWWAFKRYQGKKWLLEIFEDAHARGRGCVNALLAGVARTAHPRSPDTLAHTTSHMPSGCESPPTQPMDIAGPILPVAYSPKLGAGSYFPELPATKSPVEDPGLVPLPRPEAAKEPITLSSPATNDNILSHADHVPLKFTETAKTRFANIVRGVLLSRRDEAQRPRAHNLFSSTSARYNNTSTESSMATIVAAQLKDLRLTILTPKLRTLQPTQELMAHESPVRHMQFSPDGRFLATTSWERTSQIFRVGVEVC